MRDEVVIYGKHPAFGDFLAHGLEHEVFTRFDAWLEGVLPALKAELADNWEAAWAAAPPLNFWIGPDIVGVPLLGVFLPSQDKVGRRFPLMIGVSGIVAPPPLHPQFDHAPFRHIAAHLAQFEVPKGGTRGAATLLDGLDLPEIAGVLFEPGQDGVIWGHREDGDLSRLFTDALGADAQKAQLGRSHWWHEQLPNRHAGWLAVNGLPDLTAMRWLLTERGHDEEGQNNE
ncbi:type VI secretion system-associated protein TagF [Nereida sp. MMG025]|uniref:type VI secretion system-associated protein TagF n=1 Tax=Nereida sp. MMG025 TaxID=2909981 RepID=UPI001F2B4513|nr:type VI secretion system-associated protein TagF [Nereida sp. MMG025]MCF6445751.1 type VI secretion system-associated protein TagF [Nereida sp. MMG025]